MLDRSVASQNCWVKCISRRGSLRAVAIQASDLLREMAKMHELTGQAAEGLAEAVLGALLIASYCKGAERVNLNIQGSGFFQQAFVDAYPDARVRGYLLEREMPRRLEKHLGPWGEGFLSVLRTRDEEKGKPYVGTVPLLTGFLAKDLSFYWAQSEQLPSAVGLEVKLKAGVIVSAAGFLVQALPGAQASEVQAIEKHIQGIQSFTEGLEPAGSPVRILSHIFQSTAFILTEERELRFDCNCSWERVEKALGLIGRDELQAILEEKQESSVHCDFCTKKYILSPELLKRLLQAIPASSDLKT